LTEIHESSKKRREEIERLYRKEETSREQATEEQPPQEGEGEGEGEKKEKSEEERLA
jgi:hypothetical protein